MTDNKATADTTDRSQDKSPDEVPAKKRASKVITPKRKYFFPAHGVEIEATNPEEAEKLMDKQLNKKAGDE